MLGTKKTDTKNTIWSRRSFLALSAWGMFVGSVSLALLSFLRYLYPRVLFEPSPIIKLGKPQEYPVGEVSQRDKQAFRVWIVRNPEGFYVLSAICTHLGCTPRWLAAENKFKCPCHGSGFKKSGVNFEGPAPRPLERFAISLAEDGHLQIDKSKIFRYEKGEWDNPESFLKFKA